MCWGRDPVCSTWTVETDSQSRRTSGLSLDKIPVPTGTYPVPPAHASGSPRALHPEGYVPFCGLYPTSRPLSTLVNIPLSLAHQTAHLLSVSAELSRVQIQPAPPPSLHLARLSTFIKSIIRICKVCNSSISIPLPSPPTALPFSLILFTLSFHLCHIRHHPHHPPITWVTQATRHSHQRRLTRLVRVPSRERTTPRSEARLTSPSSQ